MGRSGSGSVGKGGREANYAPPVDQYRRRIARQDSKKEKQHLKDVKHAQETKDVAPKAVKQIVSNSSITDTRKHTRSVIALHIFFESSTFFSYLGNYLLCRSDGICISIWSTILCHRRKRKSRRTLIEKGFSIQTK